VTPDLVVCSARIEGRLCDIAVREGRIVSVTEFRAGVVPPAHEHLDARRGAVVPGLIDHHLHLFAMAAARRSVAAGPPEVASAAQLRVALRRAARSLPRRAWLRAVGYHESVAGDIDAQWIDAVVRDRPVRVQHRTGACWIVNSSAARLLGLPPDHDGRLYGEDVWLRDRVPGVETDLAPIGAELASYGVTSVTDATPFERTGDVEHLADVIERQGFPVQVTVTGGAAIAGFAPPPGVARGPVKVVVADHDLPSVEALVASYRAARQAGRGVAVHCVTRIALVLALAAWQEVGAEPGDRIEHGSVIPLELVPEIVELGLTVVTQPAFVAERGDEYLADVEPADVGDLWRCGSLRAAGVAVLGSSDAPFGPADPWRAIAAAVERRTRAGEVLGRGEGLRPRDALGLFVGERRVVAGEPADLCVLDSGLDEVLAEPSAAHVTATVAKGKATHVR
jgi:predicted amidohydrolase YtcJ